MMTVNIHRSSKCASLLQANKQAPPVGHGGDACVGDPPRPERVPTFPLRLLLRRILHHLGPRVELLKIDVQGSELSCLQSAGPELRHVDNVLLEVQDLTAGSKLMMYDGAPSLPSLDDALLRHGLVRQYCEFNFWTRPLREINCLYSRDDPHTRQLWATGNFQRNKGSMVSYDPLPHFARASEFVWTLQSTSVPGERIRLRPTPHVRPLGVKGTLRATNSNTTSAARLIANQNQAASQLMPSVSKRLSARARERFGTMPNSPREAGLQVGALIARLPRAQLEQILEFAARDTTVLQKIREQSHAET